MLSAKVCESKGIWVHIYSRATKKWLGIYMHVNIALTDEETLALQLKYKSSKRKAITT